MLASLGASACGDKDNESETLPKAELVKRANVICGTAVRDIRAVKQPANFDEPQDMIGYLNRTIPIVQEMTDELAESKPADDVKDDWKRHHDRHGYPAA